MPTNYKQKDKIRELTFGITDGLSNIILCFLYISMHIQTEDKDKINKADYLLSKFNSIKINRALYFLIQKGFIDKDTKITRLGIKKAKTKLMYKAKPKPWKGKLYLINYDIPSKANSKRVLFARLLLSNNAAMLQNSVYITPYNPALLIQNFVKRYRLPGKILVSNMDIEDTFHTALEVRTILWDAFHLEKINQRYAQFIDAYAGTTGKSIYFKKLILSVAFQYYSIIRDDPKLPKELLPDRYLGFTAKKLFNTLIKPG